MRGPARTNVCRAAATLGWRCHHTQSIVKPGQIIERLDEAQEVSRYDAAANGLPGPRIPGPSVLE
jgi:hypothetical protein